MILLIINHARDALNNKPWRDHGKKESNILKDPYFKKHIQDIKLYTCEDVENI